MVVVPEGRSWGVLPAGVELPRKGERRAAYGMWCSSDTSLLEDDSCMQMVAAKSTHGSLHCKVFRRGGITV